MDKAIIQIQLSLENIKRTTQDENPIDFWSARELMLILGYIKWQKFLNVIDKAKVSCEKSGKIVNNHFLPAPVKSIYIHNY